MKLSEIYKIADEIAPKRLSDEMCQSLGYYDNSGILVDTGDEINGMVFSLDLSNAAIEKAVQMGANVIITHHPAIFGKIGKITIGDLLGNKLIKCIKNGISVISMHLNLDLAQGGTDESLMQGILISAKNACGNNAPIDVKNLQTMHTFSGGAYGRVYDVPTVSLSALKKAVKEEFSAEHIETYGHADKKICRVASFCGAGGDEGAIAFAKNNGADVLISSDFKHHVIAMALEQGLSVMTLTHFASEEYGFKKYYEKICQQVEIPCVYHTDEILL
ncbi:MAG: Nif3-like dinuclear metal center hexameric protein [Clostridiales bacterium]|nr:Nif3-like dinuclear metal center hexameric protein [Clostridiales bacterium]